jgi:hypothetical protein
MHNKRIGRDDLLKIEVRLYKPRREAQVELTHSSGLVLLHRHHGASTLAATAPVVSAPSVAVTVATVPTEAAIARIVALFALPVVAAPLLVASVAHLPARMTVVSVTTSAATATGLGALSTATAR